MRRAVRWHIVGFCLLLGLAGCVRMWTAEREPWRREAEIACMKSGAVKEGPSVTVIKAIEGPGVCGAEHPLRVAALGESAVMSFVDEPLRPRAPIPGGPDFPRAPPPYPPPPGYSAEPHVAPNQTGAPPPAGPGMPLSLAPPLRGEPPDLYGRQRAPYRAPVETVPLGRPAGIMLAARPAAVSPAATLACPLVSALDRFVSDSVQPAAVRWFGQPVVEIKQIAAYSCRSRNGDGSGKISEHAFGNALDIAAFTLADGRKVTVLDGWHGLPEEKGFLHDVQGAACRRFTTVLAPGSNPSHYNHIHVDLRRRVGRDICDPGTVPGEEVAAQVPSRPAPARAN